MGGRGFGRFIRVLQTASRDRKRRGLAEALAPLEDEKARIDRVMLALDQAILKLETYLAERI